MKSELGGWETGDGGDFFWWMRPTRTLYLSLLFGNNNYSSAGFFVEQHVRINTQTCRINKHQTKSCRIHKHASNMREHVAEGEQQQKQQQPRKGRWSFFFVARIGMCGRSGHYYHTLSLSRRCASWIFSAGARHMSRPPQTYINTSSVSSRHLNITTTTTTTANGHGGPCSGRLGKHTWPHGRKTMRMFQCNEREARSR